MNQLNINKNKHSQEKYNDCFVNETQKNNSKSCKLTKSSKKRNVPVHFFTTATEKSISQQIQTNDKWQINKS